MARSGPARISALALMLCCTMLSGCEGYKVRYGWTLNGSSVGSRNKVSQNRCWSLCAAKRSCKVAVYNKEAKRCHLKPQALSRAKRVPGKAYLRVLSPGSNKKSYNKNKKSPSKRSPSPPPPKSRTPSRTNIGADVDLGGGGYNDNFWVHMPTFMKPNALDMTCTDLGRGFSGIYECSKRAYDMYGNNAIYSQEGGDGGGNCFVCRAGGNQDASKVNVRGKDFNRIWCKNSAYIAAWRSYRGSDYIGPTPCSHINDAQELVFWVNSKGERIR